MESQKVPQNDIETLSLNFLAQGCPCLSPVVGQYLAETATVCLEAEGHPSGVLLRLSGDYTNSYSLVWEPVHEVAKGSYEEEEATEYGACGIAILVVCHLTSLTVQRAVRGEGFDYWLGTLEGDLPFQNQGRLEVSGIRHGDQSRIRGRAKEKREQIGSPPDHLPSYITIVEFSTPIVYVEKRA